MSDVKASLVIPTVHNNGTSGQELLDQALEAAQALRKAQESLEGASPNARDYYTQGNLVFAAAQQHHKVRILRVQEIIDELMQIAESIQSQLDAKERK